MSDRSTFNAVDLGEICLSFGTILKNNNSNSCSIFLVTSGQILSYNCNVLKAQHFSNDILIQLKEQSHNWHF